MGNENLISSIFFGDITHIDPEATINILLNVKPEYIFEQIINNGPAENKIEANNIPQFSSFDDLFSVLRIVDGSPEDNLNWEKLGYYLCKRGAKPGAKIKYGENHYKLAVQLGLAQPDKKLSLTSLGTCVNRLCREKQEHIITLLILRIPLIQTALFYAKDKRFNIYDYLGKYLSDSTIRRRRSNIKTLLKKIDGIVTDDEMHKSFWNIVWEEQDYELS